MRINYDRVLFVNRRNAHRLRSECNQNKSPESRDNIIRVFVRPSAFPPAYLRRYFICGSLGGNGIIQRHTTPAKVLGVSVRVYLG